jgi:hypothetical protein
MSTTTQPPKPKRRWCRFSLRTLLVVMTVAILAFGGIGYRIHRAHVNRERMATVDATIDDLGATAKILFLQSPTLLERLFNDPGVLDSDWKIWVIGGNQFSDAEMEHLKRLPGLTTLHLENTKVTDAGLENLAGMTELQTLRLDGTKFTDACLDILARQISLTYLNLTDTKITEAGVQSLQQALPWCHIEH